MDLAPSPRFFSKHNAPRIVAAVVTGAVLPVVAPPFGLVALHWVAFLPLLWAVASPAVPAWRRFQLGWLAGFVTVLGLFGWLATTLVTFSKLPFAVAAAITLVYAVVFGLPYGVAAVCVAPLRRGLGAAWVLAFAVVWVALEYLQPAVFPYFQGAFHFRSPWIWQLASAFGPYGVSALVLAVNGALLELVWARGRPSRPVWAVVAGVGALLGATLAFGAWRHAEVERVLAAAPTLRTAVVQRASFPMRTQERGEAAMHTLLEQTATVADQAPRLVAWPESALFANPADEPLRSALSAATRAGGYALLLGGGTREPDPAQPKRKKSWNSVYLFDHTGQIAGRYDKMHLLPFGEYLPAVFEPLRAYVKGMGIQRPGTEATVFEVDGVRITTPVCYEAIVEHQMRRLADAALFVNVANDAWFGDTTETHQHAMLAAVSAMEFGRPLVRAAYTGSSMLVEPHGDILHETAPFTEATVVMDVRLGAVDTAWRGWGRHFPLVNVGLAAGIAIVLVLRRGASAHPAAGPGAG